jgi:hypothetical protein
MKKHALLIALLPTLMLTGLCGCSKDSLPAALTMSNYTTYIRTSYQQNTNTLGRVTTTDYSLMVYSTDKYSNGVKFVNCVVYFTLYFKTRTSYNADLELDSTGRSTNAFGNSDPFDYEVTNVQGTVEKA